MVNQCDIIFELVHQFGLVCLYWKSIQCSKAHVIEPSGYCSTFCRLRLLSSERISSCPRVSFVWIFGLSSSLRTLASWSFQENQTSWKRCMEFESFGNKPLLDKGFECCFANCFSIQDFIRNFSLGSCARRNAKQIFLDLNFKWIYEILEYVITAISNAVST